MENVNRYTTQPNYKTYKKKRTLSQKFFSKGKYVKDYNLDSDEDSIKEYLKVLIFLIHIKYFSVTV